VVFLLLGIRPVDTTRMSVFGTNPAQSLAGLGAAAQQAAKDAKKTQSQPAVSRQVTRLDDSVEFEDATKHATSDDGGKRRRQQHEQQQEQREDHKNQGGLDVKG
jgi:hypothetical protein